MPARPKFSPGRRRDLRVWVGDFLAGEFEGAVFDHAAGLTFADFLVVGEPAEFPGLDFSVDDFGGGDEDVDGFDGF